MRREEPRETVDQLGLNSPMTPVAAVKLRPRIPAGRNLEAGCLLL